MAKAQPELISIDTVHRMWNGMSRKEKEYVESKIRTKINSKDIGQTQRYYYGNLYPKTMAAIRRFLSGR